MNTEKLLKPQQKSFVFFGIFSFIFTLIVLFSLVNISLLFMAESFEGKDLVVGISVLVLFCLLGLAFWWTKSTFQKEEYEFFDDKIIIRRGTPISSDSTEIYFDKITQLSLILGFWQNLLFKTGDIVISTGAMGSVVLREMDMPREIFEKIQISMQKNGFHMKQDTLVQDARPHALAIFMEVLSYMASTFIFLLYMVSVAGSELYEQGDRILDYTSLLFVIIGVGIVLAIISLVLKFLDLKQRKYRVFTDSIVYEEGFLTKHFSILPMEKVADTENAQGFFAKIFGLHDIIVSSEGSSNKVIFKNMIDGELMLKNIKYLKDAITMSPKQYTEKSETADDIVGYINTVDTPFEYNKDFVGEYSPNFGRSLIGMFTLMIVAFVASVEIFWSYEGDFVSAFVAIAWIAFYYAKDIIATFVTKYSITSSTIESRFTFLSNQHSTFSVEKITRVDFRTNPIDKIFGTMTVVFTSIGSSRKIIFRHIKNSENLKKNILEKIGIYEDSEGDVIPVDFSFVNYIKAHLFATIFSLGIILLFALPYSKIFYSKRFYENILHKNFVKSRYNIIFWTERYALLENIKGLRAQKYLATETGEILLSIASNQEIPNENSQKNNSFKFFSGIRIAYVPKVFEFMDFLDSQMLGSELQPENIITSPRSIKNTLISLCIVLLIIISVCVMIFGAEYKQYIILASIPLFLIFAVIIWSVSCYRYALQGSRIFVQYGIVYYIRETVLYSKVNFVNKSQNFISKICKNGNISIFTLGSSSTDMQLSDVDNYSELYEMLKGKIKSK